MSEQTSETVFLDRDSPELAFAWQHFYDAVAENDGERWQYMGTAQREGRWQHSFRHRDSPETGQREYVWIPASDGWDGIEWPDIIGD